MKIRIATIEDSAALLKIYAQYIDTAITFEYTLPTEHEFAARIADFGRDYPYLVCEEDGEIIGYAYAHRQMQRDAYQWNAELSIYLDRAATSRGAGKRLYGVLIELLKLQGIRTVYAGVTMPNEKSERLHLGLGFQPLGTYHCTGYKCNAWHDVKWFEKAILPYDQNPMPFLSFSKIEKNRIDAILSCF